jgi:hypothetical protein
MTNIFIVESLLEEINEKEKKEEKKLESKNNKEITLENIPDDHFFNA